MECLAKKAEIQSTFENVRLLSFKEKTDPWSEDRVNWFLDAINDFKSNLGVRTTKLNELNKKLESLTWFNDLDEECLMLLNDLISASKDLKSSLIRRYVGMNPIRQAGIAKNEIKEFKESVDNLQEVYTDLESVFFYLPEMPGFKETTKELSLI